MDWTWWSLSKETTESFFSVCVVCMSMYAYLHVCGHTHVYACMWRPEVNVRSHSWLLFQLVLWDRVPQNSEFGDMGSLASQFALGIPFLCLPRLGYRESATPTWQGIRGSDLESSCMLTSTLAAEPSPQPPHCSIYILSFQSLCFSSSFG